MAYYRYLLSLHRVYKPVPLVIPREGGESSTPRRSLVHATGTAAYWITRFRG